MNRVPDLIPHHPSMPSQSNLICNALDYKMTGNYKP